MNIELYNKALTSLIINVEICRKNAQLPEVSEEEIEVEKTAIDDCLAAGWDWEDDDDLVYFNLKATGLECAEETLKYFSNHMAGQVAETIIAEIAKSDVLSKCVHFSDLHDHCDANVLGAQKEDLPQEYYKAQDEDDLFRVHAWQDIYSKAQDIVESRLPLKTAMEADVFFSLPEVQEQIRIQQQSPCGSEEDRRAFYEFKRICSEKLGAPFAQKWWGEYED